MEQSDSELFRTPFKDLRLPMNGGDGAGRPPIEPAYDIPLTLHEVASQHRPAGRGVYLRKVLNIRARPSSRMVRGRVLHESARAKL